MKYNYKYISHGLYLRKPSMYIPNELAVKKF